ncbi:hypothetical protein GGX14DRAFT_573559 [Mycena pura]|uniref:Transmembrane protein n=1 Tax=Mycena pura TaxID=153505 RepID=A0AAD6Y7S2_9AGAR|nr:hypothetical protein GGX14DRAFT_573559 [Mycena pura]
MESDYPSRHSMFPMPGLQWLSAWIHFIGVTILTYFLTGRLLGVNLLSRQGWGRLSWPRLCVLLALVDSYLFMLAAGLLILCADLQRDITACTAGIYLCITFYMSSKLMMYLFLTEKVYIVWANDNSVRRLRSPVYLLCLGTICLYLAVIIAMYLGRIVEFRNLDRACEIGLKPTASLTLLSYINVLLTFLFLWPIFRAKFTDIRLKDRFFVGGSPAQYGNFTRASVAALTTSTINIVVLTALNGREFGWLCFGSFGADVVFNAAALFWATSSTKRRGHIQMITSGTERRVGTSRVSSVSEHTLQLPDLKSFHLLRHKASSRRLPTEFQIQVTKTSQVDLSPPVRNVKPKFTDGDLPIQSEPRRNSETSSLTAISEDTKVGEV